MTKPMTFPRRPLAIITLLACLLGGLVVAAGGESATASPNTVRAGLGRHSGGDFIGYYLTRDGTKVYCMNPRKGTPTTVSLRTVGRYPGLTAAASNALSFALATWGNARTRDAAAVESQVVNTLAGNHGDVARRNRHLPTSLRRLVSAHVSTARAMRGPYLLRVTTPASPLPGGSAVGRISLVSATSKPVAGAHVVLRATSNARLPGSVRLDRRGSASFRYSVTDVGGVRVSATAAGLPAAAVRISDPRPGQQRLAAPSARVTAHAASAFQGTVSGFAHRYTCTSDCAGRPALSLSACAPASRTASRIVYRIGARVVVTTFPAASQRRCLAATATAPDRSAVTATWQFNTGRGWSRPVTAGGAFVVDCPAPAAVTVNMVSDCTRASVTIGLARPGLATPAPNTSSRRAVLTISGSRSARVYALPGRPATWSASMPCGAHQTLTFRSGVQRLDGTWNYSRAASVITP